MAKFEFTNFNIYEQAKELLKAFKLLSSTGKKYGIILSMGPNTIISERTAIQIIGKPSCYSGILKQFIAENKGMVEYNSIKSQNIVEVNMVILEEQ